MQRLPNKAYKKGVGSVNDSTPFVVNDDLLFSFLIVDVTMKVLLNLCSICVSMRVVPNLYSSTASGPPSPLFGKEERRLKVTFAYDTV